MQIAGLLPEAEVIYDLVHTDFKQKKAGLNAFVLKLIAAAAMLCDHVAVVFVGSNYIMRAIGRIAFPIFAYFVAEGYLKTRDAKKYALRLLVFSLVAQVPYALAFGGELYKPNVIFTLFLGLIAIYIIDKGDSIIKFIIPMVLAVTAELIGSDHGAFGVVMVIVFYIGATKMIKLIWAAFLILIMQTVIVLQYQNFNGQYLIFLFYLIPICILCLYNGEKGTNNLAGKWFFYLFYPLHLLLIWLLNIML
jgi:hypothetical protein